MNPHDSNSVALGLSEKVMKYMDSQIFEFSVPLVLSMVTVRSQVSGPGLGFPMTMGTKKE
jgi:hypothetical protein